MTVDAARPVPSLCLSGENLALIARGFDASLATGRLLDEALLWAAMVTAMMLPLQVPPLRHVLLRSFRRRRARAVAAFLIGYGAVWGAAGLVMIPLLAALSTSGLRAMPLVGASALLAAATWQVLPVRAWAMRRCHRTATVRAYGWSADRDCMAYGCEQGLVCLASCLPLMLAAMIAFPGVLSSLAVAAWLYLERGYQRNLGAQSLLPLLAGALGLLVAASV